MDFLVKVRRQNRVQIAFKGRQMILLRRPIVRHHAASRQIDVCFGEAFTKLAHETAVGDGPLHFVRNAFPKVIRR